MDADDRCSTTNCRRSPVLTYLEARLCRRCWERVCEETDDAEAAAAEPAANDERPEGDAMQEIKMSKKSTKKTSPTEAKKAAKLAKTPKAKVEKAAKPPRASALNAAATVLAKAGKPMRSSEMIAAMAEQKLWTSPGGKTPEATLYAAIIREIRDKKGEARFEKVERGLFTARKA